jgi:hypothetical protein
LNFEPRKEWQQKEKIGVRRRHHGRGIAQVVAQAGFETLLYDIKQEFIDAG